MSEPSDRLINLLGALAIGVWDRIRWDALDVTELGGESAAALVVIGHSPGLSIDQLRRVLRLSHPGTVRLVDRLTTGGLAVRTVTARDRRVAALNLTRKGKARRISLLARRRQALKAILKVVGANDRAALERAAGQMLRALPEDAISAMAVCRFCNHQKCKDCPMDTFGAI